PCRHYNHRIQADQFDREIGESIIPSLCPSVLDGYVLALNVAKVTQPLSKRFYVFGLQGGRRGAEITDQGHPCRLLPLCDERRSTDCEKCNQRVTPVHLTPPVAAELRNHGYLRLLSHFPARCWR